MFWVLVFVLSVLSFLNLSFPYMHTFLKRLIVSIFLSLGFTLSLQAQEISNVRVGYVPDLKRYEVFFDLDSKLKEGFDLNVYVQEFPNGSRKQVEVSSIYGLNLKGVLPGFNYYFQIDAKGLSLPQSEYVFEITSAKLQATGDFRSVDSTITAVSNSEPSPKINIIPNFDQSLTFTTLGISPFALSGVQSGLTVAGHFGVIRGGLGYGLTVLHGVNAAPSTNFETSNTLISNYTKSSSIYRFTKEVQTSRLSIVPSFLLGIKEYLYVHAGMGYGSRALYWSADEFNFSGEKTGSIWAKNSYASQSGLELEAGLNFIYKRVHIASGINYLGILKSSNSKAFSDVWLGFGLNF